MSILDEAAELINGQRAADYGDVRENFGRIAQLWSAYHGAYFNRHDVAVFMILVKVARQSNTYHRDSMIDIAGYAALDEKVSDDLWEDIDAKIVEAQEKRERDRTQKPLGSEAADAEAHKTQEPDPMDELLSSLVELGAAWGITVTADDLRAALGLDTEQKGSK